MASSTLHLTVDKGPKQGETLARNPGALIRIGRVIKGNTFAIKDPAISQKHLIIEFSTEISRWTIKDLDTSNGTIVNDASIPSLAPFPLSDGDIVKIGETTSMSVKIDDVGGGEAEGGLRRGRRRGARSMVVEEEDDDFVEAPKNLGRGRTRRGNSSRVSKKDEILDTVVEDSVEVRPRRAGLRTRAAVAAAAARVSKVEEPSALTVEKGKLMEKSNVEADSKEKETLDLVVEDSIEKPKNVKKGKPRKAPARNRASSAKAQENDELVRSDSAAENIKEKGESNVESIAAHDGSKEKGNGEEEKEKRVEEENEKKVEEEKRKRVEEEINVDFEKMTLAEWFDSMEKYLPQAINEAAEQMIASLREKARLFDEYIINASNEGYHL